MAPGDCGSDWTTYERPAYYSQIVLRQGTSPTQTWGDVWSGNSWSSDVILWEPPKPRKNWRWFHCFDVRPEVLERLDMPRMLRARHVVQERMCRLERGAKKRRAWLVSLRGR